MSVRLHESRPMKIFVEGYLVIAVQAESDRQVWVALLWSREELLNCLLQEWSLNHQHQNYLELFAESPRWTSRLNESALLGAGLKNLHFMYTEAFV